MSYKSQIYIIILFSKHLQLVTNKKNITPFDVMFAKLWFGISYRKLAIVKYQRDMIISYFICSIDLLYFFPSSLNLISFFD